ncbi:MAG TPA: hypothetical protein VG796_06925 [Verrucomicrobiales bacterium]|nr:hypothetical protein [Verrucomicrobiales bacterium]
MMILHQSEKHQQVGEGSNRDAGVAADEDFQEFLWTHNHLIFPLAIAALTASGRRDIQNRNGPLLSVVWVVPRELFVNGIRVILLFQAGNGNQLLLRLALDRRPAESQILAGL